MKRFKFAIRTTPWGSIEPHQGFPTPSAEDAKRPGLCGESKYLGIDKLPALGKN
jgi:hypothetical protein